MDFQPRADALVDHEHESQKPERPMLLQKPLRPRRQPAEIAPEGRRTSLVPKDEGEAGFSILRRRSGSPGREETTTRPAAGDSREKP